MLARPRPFRLHFKMISHSKRYQRPFLMVVLAMACLGALLWSEFGRRTHSTHKPPKPLQQNLKGSLPAPGISANERATAGPVRASIE